MANSTELLFERPENVTSMADFLLRHPNSTYFDGGLGLVLMGTIFLITFGSLTNRGNEEAFGGAAFVTFIATTLLAVLGIIGVYGWSVAFILLASAVVLNSRGP